MSSMERNLPIAGLAAAQALRSSNSHSSGAEYTWHTTRWSGAFFCASIHVDSMSASVGAGVLIVISSGLVYAPWAEVMADTNLSTGPTIWPVSSKIARMGDSPCAVLPSADSARYSTFLDRPTRRLPEGWMRTSLDSLGLISTILRASSKTTAAWSLDCAPDTIWEFCTASGPHRWARRMPPIRAVLPFLRAIDRMAVWVPTGLS